MSEQIPQQPNEKQNPPAFPAPAYNSAPVFMQAPAGPHQVIYGKDPQAITCPYCNQHVMTVTEKESGLTTWIATGVTCLVFCPCFFVPLLIEDLKDTVHKCSNCHAVVGEKKLIK
ncbi:LITAF-like zinc ribbon domain-containing protein [Globomyces pollinis-pini]|nr:LITAF-like zinc ribbon domain-containing protein [Globomyces pollinis-pini]